MASADLTLAEPALAALRSRIDERLKQATSAEDPTMDEMASHLVLAGGKRFRPIMTALASRPGPTATPPPTRPPWSGT